MNSKTIGLIACVGLLIAMANPLLAGPIFSQGFESNTDGWFDEDNGWAGDIERVSTGPGGITSSSGSFHATAIQTDVTGIGLTGPFSNFSGLNSNTNWPGGITVSTDIYLDTSWDAGEGFDYSTAISDSSGNHLRDFIFHVTKDTSPGGLGLLVGGSNNTTFDPRLDLKTINHFEVTSSGWYTFQHVFREESGDLVGDLILRNDAGDLLFTETRTNGDSIATTGGARYSWLTNIDIVGGIALDNHSLSAVPEPSSVVLFGFGALGLLAYARQRKRTRLINGETAA